MIAAVNFLIASLTIGPNMALDDMFKNKMVIND